MSAPVSSTLATRSRVFSSISGSGRWFGKVPSDSQKSSMTSAPRRRSSSGAKLPAMPLPASTTTLSGRARVTRAAMASKYSRRGLRSVRRPVPRSKPPPEMVASSPWISSSVRGAAPACTIFTPLSETGLWLPVTVAPPSSFQ